MPIQCRLVDREKLREQEKQPKPGDMWFVPKMVEGDHAQFYFDHYLSNQYKKDWLGKRLPIMVCLPNGQHTCLDCFYSDAKDGNGWTITGEPPSITVMPSINCMGTNGYHGWLKDGILSDDLEGRSYA